MKNKYSANCYSCYIFICIILLGFNLNSQVKLLNEVQISDKALHFDGKKVSVSQANSDPNGPYDFFFGANISAHGDCIKSYKQYVFMTWYKGGKSERNVMLTRYNTITGTKATIEFPHKHNGFQNNPFVGESHNTIAIGVSPLDGTIHLLYDMHAYSRTKPSNGSLAKDYFRYSYSKKNIASISDDQFTLNQFVANNDGGYKHLSLNGGEDYSNFKALTYPQFFLNDLGDLFMYMREGGNNNGAYKFSKYNASNSTWSGFTHFNVLNARQRGQTFNWGLYGDIKYENGKTRIAYQRRLSNNNDKYTFQNGIYYAFSDSQDGISDWKNYKGENFSLPLIDSDKILVTEPGDLVETTAKDQVYIVGGFDWTVTKNDDVHIISRVQDRENNITKNVHTYKKKDDTTFVTTTEFSGASSIYTSGDNVYIIGLNNEGRIFVERARGGTNNFTKVYEATSGRRFDHGRVYISNGILYYYLMEKKSGSAQPIYLQVIDLDIDAEPKPLQVTLTSLKENDKLIVNRNTVLKASAFSDNGIVTKVDFLIDGALFNSDNIAPFTTDWNPSILGTHTIEVIGYSSANEIISSGVIKVNVEQRDLTDLTGDVYRFKNLETGKYLDSEGSSVIASIDNNGDDKNWELFKVRDNVYNIASKVKGVLRAAGSPFGTIINTSKNPPTSDGDKIWSVRYNESDNTYSFSAGANRFLYNDANDKIIYSRNLDNRSKWLAESITNTTLSTQGNNVLLNSINVYPNPTSNSFTIALNGVVTTADIYVHDVLGKLIYNTSTIKANTLISNNGKFKVGMYFVTVIVKNSNTTYRSKLIIK